MRIPAAVCAAALASCALEATASCGSAFCLINTDWSAQGAWVDEGVRLDLRAEFIDLDRVEGSGAPGGHQEVETKNRNWVTNVDWTLAPAWGLSFSIPYVDREHVHTGASWHFRRLGDVRVAARHELIASRDDPTRIASAGLIAGVKLPTGKFDVKNAAGEEAERTLQPGTGTTDLVLGGYWYCGDALGDTSWFARAQLVVPMNSRDGFKPGKLANVDGGYRRGLGRDLAIMLQLNAHWKGRDSGENAEPEDSGMRQLFVSPGISWNVTQNAQVYGFAQFPIYQSVNGVQLTAKWSALAGVSWRF